MKTVAVTRIGSLRDPDESTRGRVEVVEFPEQPHCATDGPQLCLGASSLPVWQSATGK